MRQQLRMPSNIKLIWRELHWKLASWQVLECKCRIITESFGLEGTSAAHVVQSLPQSSTSVSRLSCLGSCSAEFAMTSQVETCTIYYFVWKFLFLKQICYTEVFLRNCSSLCDVQYLFQIYIYVFIHTELVQMEFSEDINGKETNKCQSRSIIIQVTFDCLF